MKHILKSIIVKGSQEITLNNIASITISNVDSVATTFKLNSIARVLPAIDSDTGVPVGSFVIENCNHAFDIVLDFSSNTTNVVIDYFQQPKTQC